MVPDIFFFPFSQKLLVPLSFRHRRRDGVESFSIKQNVPIYSPTSNAMRESELAWMILQVDLVVGAPASSGGNEHAFICEIL